MNLNELLCDIAACLCAELTPDGAAEPDLCFCGVIPGQTFAHDYVWGCNNGKCGAAWVKLMTAYPAVAPGVPDEQAGNCGFGLGIDVEIGTIRCVEQPADGSPPDEEMMAAAVRNQMSDLVAIRRAVACCDALADLDFILGNYVPIGPQGGIAGGTWAISVMLL